MNIKSLLLGSAAALVAVSGARAADAVVIAEPEPMEYVRICDTYGTGFYYIPGTETCLRVGGMVQYDIHAASGAMGTTYGLGENLRGDAASDTWGKRARARIIMDARSETELGTLRGFFQLNFDFTTAPAAGIDATNSGDGFGIDHAYIELGGFRIGKTDSLFSSFTGYAGGIIEDDLAVPYGPYGTHQIAYTFTGGNGFSAAVALEEGDESYTSSAFTAAVAPTLDPITGAVTAPGVAAIGNPLSGGGHGINDFMPHVVAGVAWTQGWGGVSVVAGYDSVVEEGAIKGRIDVNATEQLSLFLMAGYSTNDPAGTGLGNVNANNYYAQWNGDWAIWGGGTFKANDKLSVAVQASYDEDENFAAVLAVPYQLVPGLTITPEISYADNFDLADVDSVNGVLRFTRNF